jgi:hypothetical protein
MPCTARARGTTAGSTPPYDPVINNDPCGREIISTANGVNYASHSLCLFHLMMKLGQQGINPPYVQAARR